MCYDMKDDVLLGVGRLETMSLVDTNDGGRIQINPSGVSLTNDWVLT